MEWLFFDTSALVKRYVRSERGALRVRALCRGGLRRAVLIAQLTGAEVMSGLRRRLRRGELDELAVARAWRAFERDRQQQYRVRALDGAIVADAERLITAYPLRAYDAVQLASALASARDVAVAGFRFVTADQNQAAAATAEGLDVELVA